MNSLNIIQSGILLCYKNFKKIEKFLTIKKNKSNFKILDVYRVEEHFYQQQKIYDTMQEELNHKWFKFVKKSLNVNIKLLKLLETNQD